MTLPAIQNACKRIKPLMVWCAIFCFHTTPHAETIRPPAHAGRFYAKDPTALKNSIKRLTAKAGKTPLRLPENASLKALILPHAGYIYSGWTAAHAGRVLHKGQFPQVILLGPDHHVGLQKASISNALAFRTPLGEVPLANAARRLKNQFPSLFPASKISDQKEHALEVILPFLQYYLGSFDLIPVVMGFDAADAVTQAIETILDPHTLIVASSDLSHYLPYDDAVRRDQKTLQEIRALKDTLFQKDANRACGIGPITVVVRLARQHGWSPIVLHYSNSGDTAGGRDQVVGYAAIAFYGDNSMDQSNKTIPDPSESISKEQGAFLLALARNTLNEKLGQTATPLPPSSDPGLRVKRGTFVTLKINNQLRGCIGTLSPTESLIEGVQDNALNAAFRDYRFPPLSAAELDQVTIEVSILTDPKPLNYDGPEDLLNKLRPHIDGVILRKNGASATFLPQVWEQLPRTQDFLSHLCQKAGLASNAWQTSGLTVLTYQVQYFEEHH